MLNLSLRKEFQGKNMPGTTIALHRGNSQGAIDKTPDEFLKITYPTADVIKALKTVRENRDGGPVVLMGGRGKGKSHLMAVMHHAINSPEVTENWLNNWADTLSDESLRNITIAKGFAAISETVNDNEYPNLWELLFAKHAQGQFFKGKFAESGQHIPSKKLLEEMFVSQPTCLILDEFQSWYDALPDEYKGIKVKDSAFSFIQILSEISKDRPDILMFIVSVRNNQTEAFKQIHRQTPTLIDFSGETAKKDRQNLILHRLFENRLQIPESDVIELTSAYARERFRLLSSTKGSGNAQKDVDEVCACWPFAPELLVLLEDQILMASAAQETRDMIRILAMVFKSKGETTPVITSANFSVEGDSTEVQALVDSIAQDTDQEKLREIAHRNLTEIRDSGANIPKRSEMISSIWMHSMAPGRLRGVKVADLQLAISANGIIDDNEFRLQLGLLVENSVNIHNDINNQIYWFEQSKNTKTEVRVAAKNDNLWAVNADPNNRLNHPGKDIEWLIKTMRKCFINESTQAPSDVIILGPHWRNDPWIDVEEHQQPAKWQKLVLLVVPGAFSGNAQINAELGKWLKDRVSKRRNTVRFLIQDGSKDIFADQEMLFAARCSYLCSNEAWGSAPEYRAIRSEFDKPLMETLRARFSKFAVLRKWDYQNPSQCEFDIEHLEYFGVEAPGNVEDAIEKNVFDLTDFRQRINEAAKEGFKIGEVFDDQLLEPGIGDVLAFLGEQKTLAHIQEMAAQGMIAMNVDGSWYRKEAGQSIEIARTYIRSKTSRVGSELARILLGPVDAAGGGGVVTTPTPVPNPVPQPNPQPTPTPQPNPPIPGPTPTPVTPGGDTLPPAPPLPPVPTTQTRHAAPTNGVTLTGNFETWGLKPNQILKSVTLNIDGISVQALKSFLLRLPSANKASLDVSFDPEDK